MSLLRKARAELTGAMRSVQYDLGRRPVEPPSGGPDMTSTGMSTFGGHLTGDPMATPARARRRTALVTAFAVLTVAGAAGVYLGVLNGLGSLLDGVPASAGTLGPQPVATVSFTPNSGLGRDPAADGPGSTPPAVASSTATSVASSVVPINPANPPNPAYPAPPARNASPIRTKTPARGEAGGDSPPVPTPTAPTSASPSPSGDPSGSSDPSDAGDPEPSETSATPDDSAEPHHSWQNRHRRRHR
jgi:hypothetical protein